MAKRLNYQIGVSADTSQFKADVNEAILMLNKLGFSNQVSSNLRQASKAAVDLGLNLSNAFNQDTGKLDLITFNNNLKKSGQTLNSIYSQLIQLGPEGEQAFLKVARAITQSELPLKRTSKLMSELWVTMKNTMRWQLTSSMLHGFIGSLETAYGYSKSLNTSLNNIRIVTSKSSEEMQRFAEQANNAAKALKTTTVDYTDASLIYYQQGLNDQQVQDRTETTIKLANVSRQTAEEVSSQMTAIWNNFYDGSRSLEYYADVITALGAATASSSEEIASGLQKFAPVAQVVGVSYEYATTALATLVAQTRQSEESVGTSLRTLFSRIQGLKLGETLEDGTDLNKYSEALATVGVSIKDSNGELRRMDNILDDVGAKWDKLAKDQQMALAQTVGGVRQYTAFISLMDNWGKFQENLQIATGAEGALQKQADIYAESWEAARKKVKASAEDIYDSIINEEFFIGFDNGASIVLDRIADIIDGMGGMNGLLATGSTLIFSVFGDKIADSTRRIAENIGLATGYEQTRARELQKTANGLLAQLNAGNELNSVLTSRKEILTEEVKYNIQLNELKDKLTDSERQYVSQIERSTALLKEQYELSSQQAEAAQKKVNTGFSNIFMRGITNTNISNEEILALFRDREDIKNRLLIGVNREDRGTEGAFSEAYAEELTNIIEQYKQQVGYLEKLRLLYNDYNKSVDKNADILKELGQKYQLTDEQMKKFIGENDDVVDSIRKMTRAIREGSSESEELKQILITLSRTSSSVFDGLDEDVKESVRSLIDENEKANQLKASFNGVLGVVQKVSKGYSDFANKIVTVGQVASQIAMIGSGLQSIADTFNDESLSDVERYTRLLSSVGMLLPNIISLTNQLTKSTLLKNAAKKVENAIQQEGNAQQGFDFVLTGQSAIVTKLYNKIVRDKAKAEGADGIATAKAGAALIAKTVVMLKVVAIAALVAGAIWLIVKAHNADADAAKEANEQAEKLSESYQKLKSSYESLKTTIEDYQDAYDALDNLTKGTDKFEESLDKANEQAIKLIENNKELAAAAYRDESGAIAFRGEALENYQKARQQQLVNSQISSLVATQRANDAQLKSDRTKLQERIGYSTIDSSGQELNRTTITPEQLNDVLDIINQNSDGQLLKEDLKQLANVNDQLRAVIWEAKPELEELARTQKNLIESNKFLSQEITRSYFRQFGGQNYNNLNATQQNAVNSIISAQNKELLSEARYTGRNFRDEYARIMGYEVGNYTDRGLLYRGKSTSYFDAETGEKIADISNEVARAVVGQRKALDEINNGESLKNYIEDITLLSNAANKLNVKNLDTELLGFIQKTDTAFNNLDELSYDQYRRLKDELPNLLTGIERDIDWKAMGYSNGQQYLEAVEDALDEWDPEAYFLKLANKYANVTDTALEALEALSSGKLLSESSSTKLKETFSSLAEQLGAEAAEIYNFDILSDLSNQSSFDQAASITDVLIDVANPKKLEDAQKQAVKAIREDYINQINELRKERNTILKSDLWESYYSDNIDAINKIDAQIEELQEKMQFDPIKIEIDYDEVQIKGLLTQLSQIQQAAGLIDEKYQVSADNVEKLFKIMPELLDDATIDATNGMLQLNKNTVDSVKGMANEMRLANGQLLSDVLKERTEAAQKELNLAQEVKEKIILADNVSTAEAIKNSGIEENERKRVAKEIVKAKIEQSIKETEQSAQTLSDTSNDNEQMAKSADHYASQTAQSWAQAAGETYKAFHQAFSNAIQNQEEFNAGDALTDFTKDYSNIRSVVASQFKGPEHLDYKIVREQVKNPYQELLDYIRTEQIKNNSNERRKQDKILNDSFIGNALVDSSDIVEKRSKVEANNIAKQMSEITGVAISGQDILNNSWVDKLITGGGNSTKAQELIDTLISKDAYELGAALADYSKFLSGGNSLNNAGRGEEKSTISEKDRPENFTEHFHEVNKLLEYQEKLLRDIDSEIDRTYGPERIALYQKKLEALNKQQELLQQKLDEADSGRRMEANNLRSLITNAQIDEESGVLLNYTPLMLQITAEKQTIYDAYNEIALAGTKMTEAEKINWDHRIKMADDAYEQKKTAIENYENAVKEANDAQNALNESLREAADINLDKIAHRLEVATDAKELRDNLRDWREAYNEALGDALTQSRKTGQIATEQFIDDINMLPAFKFNYVNLIDALNNATSVDDKNRIIQDLMELQGRFTELGDQILEFVDIFANLLPDAIDAARQRFDQFTNQLDHNISILDKATELLTLQGINIKDDAGFDKLQEILNDRMEAQITTAKLNKEWYERSKESLTAAEQALLGVNEDNLDYNRRKNERDALLEEYNSALKEMLSSAQEAMETAQEIFTQAIEKASLDFEKAMSGGQGFEVLQEKYDHFIEEEDRYLDKVNELYEVNKQNNKLQADIDKTTNKAHQQELKALQDEINLRRRGNTLSQYDLEILNAKYKMLLAQMALEDAQNAKTDLRLVRDRQGNWNYQYTADQGAIQEAENQLLDAQNEYYNIAKDHIGDTTSEMVKLYSEANEAIKAVWDDMTLSDEERTAKLAEIEAYYIEKVKFLEEEKNIAIQDMTQAGLEVIDDFRNEYAANLDALDGSSAAFEWNLREYMAQCQEHANDLNSTIKNLATESGTALGENGLTQIINETTNATEELGNKGVAAIDSMWNKIGEINDMTAAFGAMADEVRRAINEVNEYANLTTSNLNQYQQNVDPNVNYASLAITAAQQGDWNLVDKVLEMRDMKIASNPEKYGVFTSSEELKKQLYSGDTDLYNLGEEYFKEWIKKLGLASFGTGGYTGDFIDGKLAFLHQKELVLNQNDTENVLAAVQIARSFGPELIRNIEFILDQYVQSNIGSLSSRVNSNLGIAPIGTQLEQNMHIEAVFPNVTDHNEIKEAFNSIANDAAQWARRRKE